MAYAKPSSVTRTSTSGRASGSGVNYTVKGTTNYYVYMQDPTTYTYWRKGQITSSSGLSVNVGASDTTSDTYTTAVILSSTDLGTSCTVGNSYTSYLYWVTVPLYICKIYKGDLGVYTYNNCDHPDMYSILERSDYDEVYGITSSSSSISPTFDVGDLDSWDTFGPSVNGKTYYTIYINVGGSTSATKYYYRGSSSRKSVTATTTTSTQYHYGTGGTSGGSTSVSLGSMTTSCLSDSSYSLYAWTTSPISSSGSGSFYAYAEDAFEESNTIYGVYVKEGGTTTSNAYYYRGTNSQKSVTKTTTTADAEYYGTGQHTGGGTSTSYGTPTTSHASDTSWVFQGWATSSTSSTVYSTTASTAWGSSNTIYAVYKKTGSSSNSNVYYYRGTNSQQTATKTTTIADSLCYGTGSTSGGGTTYTYSTPTTTHETNSNYTFLGWATSANTYTSYNSNASTQWGSSNTIYGVYSKTDTMTYYPQNGTSSSNASTTNYSYGTGSTTNNIPEEPTVTYDGYSLLGWATTSTGQEDEWNDQWNNGARTVYAIWKINTIPIQIHNGTNYIGYAVYIHDGTEYVKVIPYVHNGTTWKQLTSQ